MKLGALFGDILKDYKKKVVKERSKYTWKENLFFVPIFIALAVVAVYLIKLIADTLGL